MKDNWIKIASASEIIYRASEEARPTGIGMTTVESSCADRGESERNGKRAAVWREDLYYSFPNVPLTKLRGMQDKLENLPSRSLYSNTPVSSKTTSNYTY